jgi:hypothetical protein
LVDNVYLYDLILLNFGNDQLNFIIPEVEHMLKNRSKLMKLIKIKLIPSNFGILTIFYYEIFNRILLKSQYQQN